MATGLQILISSPFLGDKVLKLVIDKSNPNEIFALNPNSTNTFVHKLRADILTQVLGSLVITKSGSYVDMDQLPTSGNYNLVLCGPSILEEGPSLSNTIINDNTFCSGAFCFFEKSGSTCCVSNG